MRKEDFEISGFVAVVPTRLTVILYTGVAVSLTNINQLPAHNMAQPRISGQDMCVNWYE